MTWEVEFTDEFGEWWESLSSEQQEEITAAVELIGDRGPDLGRPLVDTLKGSKVANLKELRIGTLRILFVFDPRRVAILLLGGDKAEDWSGWYQAMVPVAQDLYEIHLRELRKEGLIDDS